MKAHLRSVLRGALWLLLLTGLLGSTTACTYLIRASTRGVAAEPVERTFKLRAHQVEPFVQCLESADSKCDDAPPDLGDASLPSFFSTRKYRGSLEPLSTDSERGEPKGREGDLEDVDQDELEIVTSTAEIAREVLNHDVQTQLNAIFDLARGVSPPAGDKPHLYDVELDPDGRPRRANVTFTLGAFEDYQSKIEAATLLGGWDALQKESELFDTDPRDARRWAYIMHYFEAYFRQGRFFQATLKGGELKKKLASELEQRLPGFPYDPANEEDRPYEDLVTKLFTKLKFGEDDDNYVFGNIEDEGFVSRGGQEIKFPAVEASVTLGPSATTKTEVDYVSVGSDLIRVLLHAIFDAKLQVPPVSNATVVTAPVDPMKPNDGSIVDAEEFGRIETRAAQIEGVVSAGTGRLIRGVSFISLNNEALASAIETAVGVAVRKQAEKVFWCWYACRFNEAHDGLGDYTPLNHGEELLLTVRVEGIQGVPRQGIEGEATQGRR